MDPKTVRIMGTTTGSKMRQDIFVQAGQCRGRITGQGEETLVIDGQPVPSRRYEIAMDEGPITLWYTRDSSQWLALQAVTEGGRTLRYQPVQLPFATGNQGSRLTAAASP